MGNSQAPATRRVTFEREQTGLIAISDSVAKRLRSGEASHSTRSQEESGQNARAFSSLNHQARTTSDAQTAPEDAKLHVLPRSGVNQDYLVRADLGSADLQQQQWPSELEGDYNAALSKLDEQWQERYKRLEGDSEHVKRTSSEELQRAIKHVEGLLELKSQNVVSGDLQQAVVNCYKQNTTRTLNCSEVADAFVRGVESYKTGFLGKQQAL